jgi:hypothetical protein
MVRAFCRRSRWSTCRFEGGRQLGAGGTVQYNPKAVYPGPPDISLPCRRISVAWVQSVRGLRLTLSLSQVLYRRIKHSCPGVVHRISFDLVNLLYGKAHLLGPFIHCAIESVEDVGSVRLPIGAGLVEGIALRKTGESAEHYK